MNYENTWYPVTRIKKARKVPENYGLPSYSAMQLLDFHHLESIPTEDDLSLAHWLIGEAGVDLVDGIQGVFLDALEDPGSMGDKKFVKAVQSFSERFMGLGEDKHKEYEASESEPLRRKICEKLLARAT